MKIADIPDKFPIPFANAAGGSYIRPIPEASQIGIEGGAASLTDGFVPLNFQPRGAGGIPPFGEDFNGLFNQITAWTQWQNAGAPITYDSTFQTDIGGYPKGAIVNSATTDGVVWQSTVDDNVTNPDADGAGWQSLTALTTIFGQARLSVVSGVSLKLAPYQGNLLTINGVAYAIPGGGVTIANTGLTASTLYYVYAYMNSGTMTLELSATGHSTATNGVETKTGDATRSLVGMIRTQGSTPGQFVDSATQRFCANWFNRGQKAVTNTLASNSSSSGVAVDIMPSNHAEFLSWGDDAPTVTFTARAANNFAGSSVRNALALDGVQFGTELQLNSATGGSLVNASLSSPVSVAEGYHYATAFGYAGGNTASWDIMYIYTSTNI